MARHGLDDRDLARIGIRPHAPHRFSDDARKGDRNRRLSIAERVELGVGELDELVDQAPETLRVAVDLLDELIRESRPGQVLPKERNVGANDGERRAKLVGDVVDELALQALDAPELARIAESRDVSTMPRGLSSDRREVSAEIARAHLAAQQVIRSVELKGRAAGVELRQEHFRPRSQLVPLEEIE